MMNFSFPRRDPSTPDSPEWVTTEVRRSKEPFYWSELEWLSNIVELILMEAGFIPMPRKLRRYIARRKKEGTYWVHSETTTVIDRRWKGRMSERPRVGYEGGEPQLIETVVTPRKPVVTTTHRYIDAPADSRSASNQ